MDQREEDANISIRGILIEVVAFAAIFPAIVLIAARVDKKYRAARIHGAYSP